MLAFWDISSPAAGRSFSAHAGFTVIEVLVTLVLAAIVLGVALPSLQQFSANNQVVAASNSIVTGLNFARFNAITTGDDITICPSADGVACSNGNWGRNWIVFNDQDSDNAPDPAEVLKTEAIDTAVDTSGFGQAIVFRSDGVTSLGSNATITSCNAFSEESNKCIDVVVNAFGSIESESRLVAVVEE